jgi:predicted aspartyl protease
VSAELWVTGPYFNILLFGPDQSISGELLEAVIDTGASGICIDQRVANRLKLIESNEKPMQLADGTSVMATGYRAVLKVKGLGFHDHVEVFGVKMKHPSNRVLLGRSFLKRYRVNYNGPEETFHFYDANNGPVPNYLEDFDG